MEYLFTKQDTHMPSHSLPRHIAIIMDGNGRWAKQRFMPRMFGHKAGAKTVHRIVKSCVEQRIEVLTLFAFSSENWQRPAVEVSFLMNLFITVLRREIKKMHEQQIQLHLIGDRSRFDARLQEEIAWGEALTAQNTGLKLVIAANYGGRWDITEAVRKVLTQVESGLAPSAITAEHVTQQTAIAGLPAPDLLIRTSGELRISNFLLWPLEQTELYFTPVFWPDFTEKELQKACDFYATRRNAVQEDESLQALADEWVDESGRMMAM